jgi:hypothetical protein
MPSQRRLIQLKSAIPLRPSCGEISYGQAPRKIIEFRIQNC